MCPEPDAGVAHTGVAHAGVAPALPEVSTAAMDVFLAELSRAIPAATHAALVLDRAGWHVSEDLT